MKIEKHTKDKPYERDGIVANILKLKPDSEECLRLTTARQGRNIAGLYTTFRNTNKLRLVIKMDGEDVLVWTEKLK